MTGDNNIFDDDDAIDYVLTEEAGKGGRRDKSSNSGCN